MIKIEQEIEGVGHREIVAEGLKFTDKIFVNGKELSPKTLLSIRLRKFFTQQTERLGFIFKDFKPKKVKEVKK